MVKLYIKANHLATQIYHAQSKFLYFHKFTSSIPAGALPFKPFPEIRLHLISIIWIPNIYCRNYLVRLQKLEIRTENGRSISIQYVQSMDNSWRFLRM
jgi:hypothetical protein